MSTRTRRSRRGANAVEFALVMPLIVGLFSAIVDYGYLFAVRYGATAAAEEGARAGSLVVTPDDPLAPARDAAQAKWASLGLMSSPVFTASVAGAPEMIVVRADVAPFALVGLERVGAFHVTSVRRRETP